MKCKKIICGLLGIILMFSTNSGIVKAEDGSTDSEINYVEISKEEVVPDSVEENKANRMERQYKGPEYSISGGVSTYSDESKDIENTDLNYAYLVEDEMVVQGAIATEGEMRWYAFNVTEESKVTILLQMVSNLDADLYMFALNGSSLDLIGGSASEGQGVTEYYNQILQPGMYFFAVGGYQGTGNFAFTYYQKSKNIDNNDTIENATSVSLGTDFTGVIDNPYDVDYYKVTFSKPTIMKHSFTTTDSYSMTYVGSEGSEAACYQLEGMTNTCKYMPGTYYFKVKSDNGTYSVDSTYTVNFKSIGKMSTHSGLTRVAICEKANMVYETNSAGTIHYVNGNEVDYSYTLYKNLPNSTGLQIYDISIDTNKVEYATYADVLYYLDSTQPAYKVSSRPLLELTLVGNSCYNINCLGTGAYSDNTFRDANFDAVKVLIDPDTGLLVDILEYNYFYEFAPVGTNYINYYRGGYEFSFFNFS